MFSTMSGTLKLARVMVIATLLLLAAGCAATPGRTHNDDPWEKMNRGIYRFNDTLDRAALKPVAKGYKAITPRWVRSGIGNFFANITYPVTIVNQFLQGNGRLGLRDTGRFLVNSTIGVAGLIDVATRMGLEANQEDFGQTLAKWGVGSGPYLTLPFFGPSTLRDAPSRVVDYFTQPLSYADMSWESEVAIRAVSIVHDRADLLSIEQTLRNAYDPYAFMRDAWIQQREFAIFDGNPPPEVLEEEEPMDEDTPVEEPPAPNK